MTPKEFIEGARDAYDILNKLSFDDLLKIARMFNCIPSHFRYDDEEIVKKNDLIEALIRSHHDLMRDSESAARMNEGLRLLGLK